MTAIVSLLSLNSLADDTHNHIHLDQVASGASDNLSLSIDQIGYENLIRFSFNHNDNTVNLLQLGNKNYIGYNDAWGSGYSWGGDLDGLRNNLDIRQKCSKTSCNDNDFQFHVWGDDNTVKFGQGYSLNDSSTPTWSYDGNEPGGQFVRLDIHGDDNTFIGSQKMDNSAIRHNMTVGIYADDNEVYARQAQNGDKTLTLTIYNDGNDVSINQRDNGEHTATITLTGTNPTDLFLLQKGNTTQNYSLSQNCLTSGGCTINVTQQ